jgi:hypothetical protein
VTADHLQLAAAKPTAAAAAATAAWQLWWPQDQHNQLLVMQLTKYRQGSCWMGGS